MEWMNLVGQGGALVIVAWVVYYMFSKGLPEMNARHAAESQGQREAHMKAMAKAEENFCSELKNARESFLGALQLQRVDFREELSLERATNASLAKTIQELSARIMAHDTDMRVAHAIELSAANQRTATAEAKGATTTLDAP